MRTGDKAGVERASGEIFRFYSEPFAIVYAKGAGFNVLTRKRDRAHVAMRNDMPDVRFVLTRIESRDARESRYFWRREVLR